MGRSADRRRPSHSHSIARVTTTAAAVVLLLLLFSVRPPVRLRPPVSVDRGLPTSRFHLRAAHACKEFAPVWPIAEGHYVLLNGAGGPPPSSVSRLSADPFPHPSPAPHHHLLPTHPSLPKTCIILNPHRRQLLHVPSLVQ